MDVKLGRGGADDPLENGSAYRVVLAEDSRGRSPVQKSFFANRKVDKKYKKKMRARLRNIARYGVPVANSEAYKCFDGDIHYIKIHGYRAYALARTTPRGSELVVCVVCEKRHSGSLSGDLKLKARQIFKEHCERYPG